MPLTRGNDNSISSWNLKCVREGEESKRKQIPNYGDKFSQIVVIMLTNPSFAKVNAQSLSCNPESSSSEELFVSKISAERLWSDIHTTADWGRLPSNHKGITRLALTEYDRCIRDWFCDQATQMGCEIKIDEIGNIFAILPGESIDVPPIGIGSHLDTQPAGGRFDGILGVMGGLEIIREIKRSKKLTYAPIAVVNWTNEEGSRYLSGCTGSAVWSKAISVKAGHNNPALDRKTTLRDDLQQVGYLGPWPSSYEKNPLSAHFELHIEQGRRLENENKTIGVVDSVQGIRWYTVRVRGEQAHAGSTLVASRADAIVSMSKFIVFLESLAIETGVYATVGVIEVKNGSSNVVSGNTSFTVDLRHPNEDLLDEVEGSIREGMHQLSMAKNCRITFDMEKVWHSQAVNFSPEAIQCVLQAGRRIVGPNAVMGPMISHAGHDSALIASAKVPTAMIFVPSKDGLSHCPDEWTSKEDCEAGVQTLYEAVRLYDDHLRETKLTSQILK